MQLCLSSSDRWSQGLSVVEYMKAAGNKGRRVQCYHRRTAWSLWSQHSDCHIQLTLHLIMTGKLQDNKTTVMRLRCPLDGKLKCLTKIFPNSAWQLLYTGHDNKYILYAFQHCSMLPSNNYILANLHWLHWVNYHNVYIVYNYYVICL